MKGPLDIHQYLLAHNVHHEIIRLRRAAGTAEQLCEALDVTPRRCVVAHTFRATTTASDVLVVLLAPSDVVADATLTAQLAALLADGSGAAPDLRPAGAELVSRQTDYLASHLAPLLLPPDVVVAATKSLADLATSIVYTPTGDGGTALGIRATDLLDLCAAIVLPDAVPSARADRIDLSQRPASIQLDRRPGQRRIPALDGRGSPPQPRRGRPESDAPDPTGSGRSTTGDTPLPGDLLDGTLVARSVVVPAAGPYAANSAALPPGSAKAAVASAS
jgi:Cys-tRNA(Pro)/Cys-tRNA(Cys) deacylase